MGEQKYLSRRILDNKQFTEFIVVALLSYLLVFIEWLFYVTDISISFMYPLTFCKKIEIFFVVGSWLTIICWLIQGLFFLFDFIFVPFTKKNKLCLFSLPKIILELIIGLVVFENFTYTIFHFGITTINKKILVIYPIIFLAAFITLFVYHSRQQDLKRITPKSKIFEKIITVFIGISLLVGGIDFFTSPNTDREDQTALINTKNISYPNIIIIGTDGLNADNMSVYGYSKETTPFLDTWVKDCLFSESNFTNSAKSMGSDTSILTGKSPLNTRVYFPPDILRGVDVSEHLPKLLQSVGYKTIQQGYAYYVDSGVVNVEDGFDEINFSKQLHVDYLINKLFSFRLTDEVYLFSSIINTVSTEVKEIFFIEQAENSYTKLMSPKNYGQSDHEKIKSLYTALDKAKADNIPLFAHLHLMVTHGDYFYPQNDTFSKGLEQNDVWMEPFYDDSIMDYDGYIRDLVAYLKAIDEYDNTIIIVYTDHAQQWRVGKRIPLIIHFPNDDYAGKITANTQNLDIAPTILDYLGYEIPDWMEGNSLLGSISRDRLIIAAYSDKLTISNELWALDNSMIKPPYFQFSNISAIQCQNFYILDLDDLSVKLDTVDNYANPCAQSDLDTADEVREKIRQMMIGYGYEIPSSWE